MDNHFTGQLKDSMVAVSMGTAGLPRLGACEHHKMRDDSSSVPSLTDKCSPALCLGRSCQVGGWPFWKHIVLITSPPLPFFNFFVLFYCSAGMLRIGDRPLRTVKCFTTTRYSFYLNHSAVHPSSLNGTAVWEAFNCFTCALDEDHDTLIFWLDCFK